MNVGKALAIYGSLLTVSLLFAAWRLPAQKTQDRMVRLAEIEVDPAQLETYKAALTEEIDSSIRIEPGVLTLYAVALRDNPAHIRIFETYANIAAYKAHIETPHFRRYKNRTQNMIKSLKLVETDPIVLGAKGR